MRRSLFLLSLWALLLAGCTFLPQPPDVEKITGPKVENPFFKIPPDAIAGEDELLRGVGQGLEWFSNLHVIFLVAVLALSDGCFQGHYQLGARWR